MLWVNTVSRPLWPEASAGLVNGALCQNNLAFVGRSPLSANCQSNRRPRPG